MVIAVFFLILSKPADVLDGLEKSSSQEYFTAKEAFELVRPSISMWNSDAVVYGIRGRPWHGKEEVYESPDGRMSYWSFNACSSSAKEWVHVVVIRGYTGIGWGERPGGEKHDTCEAIPIQRIVDSDVVINTAQSRVNDLPPREVRLRNCGPTDSTESVCWKVLFHIHDAQRVNIRLDAYSGEIVNIFLGLFEDENLGKEWTLD